MIRAVHLLAATLVVAIFASQHVPAQFTTIINVPPDAVPTSIGSDTQLNFDAGGDDLPASFQAGLPGNASNVEVNIFGGVVGDMFNAGPSDGSGGDVTVNIAGGTLGAVTSYAGAEVFVSGGNLSVVTAFGGDISSTTGSTATFQYFGASDAGKAEFNGGTAIGGGGFCGGFLAVSESSDVPESTLNDGVLMGVDYFNFGGSSRATLNLTEVRLQGSKRRPSVVPRRDMTGGEITGDMRLDSAYLTTVRITGGSLQTS